MGYLLEDEYHRDIECFLCFSFFPFNFGNKPYAYKVFQVSLISSWQTISILDSEWLINQHHWKKCTSSYSSKMSFLLTFTDHLLKLMHNHSLGRPFSVSFFLQLWGLVRQFLIWGVLPYPDGHLGRSPAKDGVPVPFSVSLLWGLGLHSHQRENSPLPRSTPVPALCLCFSLFCLGAGGLLDMALDWGLLCFLGFSQSPSPALWELLNPPSLLSEEVIAMINWLFLVIITNSQCMQRFSAGFLFFVSYWLKGAHDFIYS